MVAADCGPAQQPKVPPGDAREGRAKLDLTPTWGAGQSIVGHRHASPCSRGTGSAELRPSVISVHLVAAIGALLDRPEACRRARWAGPARCGGRRCRCGAGSAGSAMRSSGFRRATGRRASRLSRSVLPPSESRFCGLVPVAASPVPTHSVPLPAISNRWPPCRPRRRREAAPSCAASLRQLVNASVDRARRQHPTSWPPPGGAARTGVDPAVHERRPGRPRGSGIRQRLRHRLSGRGSEYARACGRLWPGHEAASREPRRWSGAVAARQIRSWTSHGGRSGRSTQPATGRGSALRRRKSAAYDGRGARRCRRSSPGDSTSRNGFESTMYLIGTQ